MLDFSPEKMMMIFFIVMLVLGPEKLPEVARKLGKISAELRKLSGGFQNEIRQAVNDATTAPPSGASNGQTSGSTTEVVSAGDATATQSGGSEGTSPGA